MKDHVNYKFSYRALLTNKSPFSYTEAFRTLRTNVIFSFPKSDTGNVVTVTSSGVSEGKSTVSLNLSIALSISNRKTVLIDCDMRRPSVNKYLKIRNEVGLSDFLCGQASEEEVVFTYPNLDFDIITAGSKVPNPAEVLSSNKLQQLFGFLRKEYEFIIVDTPPLSELSDALFPVKYGDGVVFVVRENVSKGKSIDNALNEIRSVDGRIIGMVFLGSETFSKHRKNKYYYYYYHSYANADSDDTD